MAKLIDYLYEILLSRQIMGSKPNKTMFFHNEFFLCDTMHDTLAKGVSQTWRKIAISTASISYSSFKKNLLQILDVSFPQKKALQ